MRLPWPFGRSTEAPDGPAADRPDSVPPAAPGAWASLPPIQRSIGAAPLVAPTEPFLADVPGARPLPPIVETLGHDVSPMAPVGLVAAPVHATPSLTSHAALVPPPVQRRAAAARGEWPSPGAAEAAAPSVAQVVAPAGPSRTLGIVPPEATVQPPARSLTRAEATAVPTPAASAHGLGGEPAHRPLLSRRTQISSTTHGPVSPPATFPAPSSPPTISRAATTPALAQGPGPSHRAGLGAPLPATPQTAVSPAVASAFPATVLAQLAAAQTTGRAPDDLVGQAPGAAFGGGTGVGPPDQAPQIRNARPGGAGPLATTRVQRRIGGPAGSAAAPAGQREDGHANAPGLELVESGTGTRNRLPVLPVVSRQRDAGAQPVAALGGEASVPRSAVPGTGGAADAHAAVATAGPEAGRSPASRVELPMRRPLLGNRPIQTSVQTQRVDEPSADGPEGGGPPVAVPPPARPTAGQMGVSAEEYADRTSIAGQLAPPSGGHGGSTAVAQGAPAASAIQRRVAVAPDTTWPARRPDGAFGAGDARQLETNGQSRTWADALPAAPSLAAVVSPAVQRRVAGSSTDVWAPPRPVGSSPRPRGGPGDWPTPVSGPAAGDRAPAMSLVRAPQPAAPSAPAAAAPPTISRSIVAAEPAPPPAVQTSTQSSAATAPPVLGVTATPVIQRIDGSAPTPPPDSGGHSDKELDELARAIFGRIRNRLRNEYIHEREAKGLTFDNS